MGVVAGVNDFKKQHPRGFVGAICGSVFFLLVLLSSRRNGIRESFTPYAYSPYGGETPLTLAIRPAGIKAAATRAEQLWANNVKKRNEFIKWKGGVDAIRMFTPREEPGWGQLYTIWVSLSCIGDTLRTRKIPTSKAKKESTKLCIRI